MKITKRQLRRIIKEEKARVLNEMNPRANAERMQGMYSNISDIDAVENAIKRLMLQTGEEISKEMDPEDADVATVAAVTLTVAQALESLGLLGQYHALMRTLQ